MFNERKKTQNLMTLSGIFSMLTSAVSAFKGVKMTFDKSDLITKCISELQKLQSLFGFIYWWPEEGIDDPESVHFVRRELQSK